MRDCPLPPTPSHKGRGESFSKVCVLADDLTGGNATASLLQREGMPSHTHLFPRSPAEGAPPTLRQDGAHILDLDTRERTAEETAARLTTVLGWVGNTPDLISLRIDSTLRGPVPAALDVLLQDRRQLGLVLPAFPASGRTTCGGIHYVFGVPMAETEVARDPCCPVTSSRLDEWIGGRMAARSASLDIEDVRSGCDAIVARLEAHLRAGVRAVLCDAETDLDIEDVARAALIVRQRHGIAILPADPGPFTATLVRLMKQPPLLSPLVFGIVGSVMETSSRQMDFVEAGGYAFTVHYAGQSAADLLAAFEQAPPSTKAMLLRTDTAPLNAEDTGVLYDTLGALFENVVARFPSLGGFLLSGGETAGRLLARFGVRSLRLRRGIMPLVCLSSIVDGRLAGRYLVTKGGTVGTTSAIADSLGCLYDLLADGPVIR